MNNPLDRPLFIFALSFSVLWFSAQIGVLVGKKQRSLKDVNDDNFTLIVGAVLTLLGLITGFTFSMAVNRYDQRKNYEEQEANTIGTEYVRTSLLPAAYAARVRPLMMSYLDQRLLYYESRDQQQLRQITVQTGQLETQLWSAVAASAAAQPTPVASLVLAGMNNMLDSRGYTEAAWRNRVPVAAWALLVAIAVFCNLLVGYGARGKTGLLLLALPFALSVSFFLIADIDSPRGGIIHVHPENLRSLTDSLHPQ